MTSTTTKTTRMTLGLIMAALLLFPLFPLGAAAGSVATVDRSLQEAATCGRTLTVTLLLDWGAERNDPTLIIEEVYPAGWTAASPSNGGSREDAGKLKWFLTDPDIRQVTYQLTIPSGAVGTASFDGAYRDDTMSSGDSDAVTTGVTSIEVACPAADVTRSELPAMACGETYTIRLTIGWHETDKRALALEEHPPSGWTISQPSNGGSLETGGTIKWFLNDTAIVQVTYRVTVAASAAGAYTFFGSFRDDSMAPSHPDARVEGDGQADVSCGADVRRTGLGSASCGDTFTATLQLDWAGAQNLFIEETYPGGWTVRSPSNGGSQQTEGTVKWFLSDPTVDAVSYQITIPAGAAGTFTFSGAFRDDTMPSTAPSKAVLGETSMTATCGDGPQEAQVERSGPTTIHPQSFDDQSVVIGLDIDWNGANSVTIQEGLPPSQLLISDISHGGSRSGSALHWDLSDPSVPKVTYRITVPSTTDLSIFGPLSLTGTFADTGGSAPIGGIVQLRVLHRFDAGQDCMFDDSDLFTVIGAWKSGGATDNELFSGIDAWKRSPGDYCNNGGQS